MVPLRLQLRNFLSYRGAATIDFSDLELACLSGENGSGKSALLDAMTWAIWGESRAQRDADLISLGESESEVTFEFRMGARDYRVMRRRTHTRPTLEFDSRTPGSDGWLPIGGDSVRDTQARIVRELRLDYETFANSAFLRQGQADLFTQNKPGDRKRILAEILDLSGYDRLVEAARAEQRTRRTRLDEIHTRIGQIDLQLAGRHEKEVQLAELDEAANKTEARISEVRTALDTLRDRLASAEMAEEMLERTKARIARLNEQTADLTGQRASIDERLAELVGIVDREDEIVLAVTDQRGWRAKADEMSGTLSARQPLLARAQEIEREMSQAAAELERRMALLRQTCDANRRQISQLDGKNEEAVKLRKMLAEHQQELNRTPQVTARLEQLQTEVADLSAQNTSLRERMNEIQQRIAGLSEGDATCPICRRPLDSGDHAHIHEQWTVEGRKLGDVYRENKARIDELQPTIVATRQEIEMLTDLGRRAAGIEARLQQLQEEIDGREKLASELESALQESSKIEQQLADGTFLVELRREMKDIEQRLGELPYDEKQHREARERSKDLEAAERAFQELERAKADIAVHRKQINELDTRLGEIASELKEAEQDAGRLGKSLEGIETVRDQYEKSSTEYAHLTASVAELERSRGSLRRQIEELDELGVEHDRLRKEATGLAAETDAYGELTTAFGRNGIQAMVIENVLPELEEETNRILSRMTTKQLEVQFRTTREAISSDSTIETLDIIIRDEYGTRPYQLFSGGEAFRINFAIRVALSKLLARRAGASVDTLFIDEGFGTQDQHGRDGLIEALQSISRDFELILVITHVDELRNQFPNRIEIVKTDNGSRATLI